MKSSIKNGEKPNKTLILSNFNNFHKRLNRESLIKKDSGNFEGIVLKNLLISDNIYK